MPVPLYSSSFQLVGYTVLTPMAHIDAYDGIIFDYGGVLAHHQTPEDQARLAAVAGIPLPEFGEFYWSQLRLDYDKGVLSGTEYWLAIASCARVTLTPEQIEILTEFDSLSWMNYDHAMWDWIETLRAAGKRLAILSNMPRDLGEVLRTRTRRFQDFDHVTLSYEVGSVKPEPLIYHDCLTGIATPGNRTLFLDDRIVNVHAAEELGIHALQFTSRDEVLLQFL
jgi:putative hydrolase of the HAD superfamily